MESAKSEGSVICPRCEQEVYKGVITCPFCRFGIMAWLEGAIDAQGGSDPVSVQVNFRPAGPSLTSKGPSCVAITQGGPFYPGAAKGQTGRPIPASPPSPNTPPLIELLKQQAPGSDGPGAFGRKIAYLWGTCQI